MKKTLSLTLSLAFLFISTIHAQILTQDFGEGLAYPINEESSFDFTGDGIADIIINGETDRFSIQPIYQEGCIHAYEGIDETINGVRITFLEEGDEIRLSTFMNFEEDEVLPLLGDDSDNYPDWGQGEARYIGLLGYSGARPAWMKIRIDEDAQILYLISYGMKDDSHGTINAGQTFEAPVAVEELKVKRLAVYPNPVVDLLNIELELEQAEKISFSLKSVDGQQVKFEERALSAINAETTINVTDLASGIYQLVIRSENKVITKTVTIGR